MEAAIIGGLIALVGTVITVVANQVQSQNEQSVNEAEFEKQNNLAKQNIEIENDVAGKNFQLQQDQFAYQKQLNELQMQREDTAMQRQVADLKKAGLSPLLASGGSPTGSLVSGTAPQFNSSGISSALSNMLGVRQDYASRKQQAYQFQRQMQLQTGQAFSNLIGIKLDNDMKREQIKAQQIANAYNEEHGLRDPSAVQAVVDYVMDHIDKKGGVNPTLRDLGSDISGIRDNLVEGVTNVLKDNAEKALGHTVKLAQSTGRIVSTGKEKLKNKASEIVDYVKDTKVGQTISKGINKSKNSKVGKFITDKYKKYQNKKKYK